MSSYTLYLGDCLEVMPGIPDNSIDLIATDPPYYKVKGEYWDRQWDTPTGFIEWVGLLCKEWQRILRPNGSLYVFASPRMAARVEVEVGEWFNVLENITWVKPNPGCSINHGAGRGGRTSKEGLRSYFPRTEEIIFAEHYGADNYAKGEAGYNAKCDELRGFVFEPLRAYLDGELLRSGVSRKVVDRYFGTANVTQYWWQQRGFIIPTQERYEGLKVVLNQYGIPPNGKGAYLQREYEELRREYEELRREYEELRRPFAVSAEVPYTDVWDFPTVNHYPGKHPCEKPLALMEHIILSSSKPGATVLDCFFGSCSTGRAAIKHGRRFIGIEKDPDYFKIGQERMERVERELRGEQLTIAGFR